jgi:Protein of unknown function (DUF1258)
MYRHVIQLKRLCHCDHQQRTRLDKKKRRQREQRRIDAFKTLLHLRISTIKPEPIFQDHQEQVILNTSECEQNFRDHVDDDLVANETDDRSEVIGDRQYPCVFDGGEDSKSERDICEDEEVSSSSDDSDEECEDRTDTRLHDHTNVSTLDCCKDLSSFLRKANVNNSSSLLRLIKSLLPVPNNMPCSTENLLSLLGVRDLFVKRAVCLACKQYFEYGKKQCPLCQTLDEKQIAHIFDIDICESLTTIVERLSSDIEEYKQLINDHHHRETANDIPFRLLYQALLNRNPTQNLISLLLHLDGIGLTKSTQLKLWLFSGSIVELPAKLRHRRHNMVLMSMWIGYSEPEPDLWLKSIVNEMKYLKTKGSLLIRRRYLA